MCTTTYKFFQHLTPLPKCPVANKYHTLSKLQQKYSWSLHEIHAQVQSTGLISNFLRPQPWILAVNTFFVFVAESYEGGGVDWKFGDGVLALAGAMTCDVNSGSSKSSLKPAKSALEEMPIAANLRSVSVVCCKW